MAIVGLGNRLAGDDGLGLEVVQRLHRHWRNHPAVLLYELEGDLMAVADLLHRAQRFVFVDAVAGARPGEIVVAPASRRAFAPSLHQTDMAAVMSALAAVGMVEPFPAWEVWGVVIDPPQVLRPGLSPEVEGAIEILTPRLSRYISELVGADSG